MDPSTSDINLPKHVAIIMDGNGRWAKKKHLPRIAGHKSGLEAVRRSVEFCAKNKIEVLTLFAFSSENWRRPKKEVKLLMDLFLTALQHEVKKLHENNVRVRIIGDRSVFEEKLQLHMQKAEDLTKNNTGLCLVIAVNYGGRWEIVQAAKTIADKIKRDEIRAEELDEQLFGQHLSLNDLPEPDLFIRTGGEERVSNFLLWHLAYTEFYFTQVLWPDFNEAVFLDALQSFSTRQRRFGRTGEQVEQRSRA